MVHVVNLFRCCAWFTVQLVFDLFWLLFFVLDVAWWGVVLFFILFLFLCGGVGVVLCFD